MKYKAIIFDLDGTLLNTIDDLADSMNIVLERLGFPIHEVNKYKYFIGNGIHNLVRRTLPVEKQDEDMVIMCAAAMRDEYSKRMIEKTRPYEGIIEMLSSLSLKNIRMSILSNKPDPDTKMIVEKLLPEWRFDIVHGERQGIPRKPDPAAVMEIVKFSNLSSDDFLYLGDSGVDMETANAAGMFAVGALWGFRTADELERGGAKVLIKKPEELLDLL